MGQRSKVEHSAERFVSLLLDLIQTRVNYVIQEAVVMMFSEIKDIVRKYLDKYKSTIWTP